MRLKTQGGWSDEREKGDGMGEEASCLKGLSRSAHSVGVLL